MRLLFIRQSKGKAFQVAALVSDYTARMQSYGNVVLVEPKSRGSSDRTPVPAAWWEPATRRIVLDERGRQHTSIEMADRLKKFHEDPAVKTVAFFVGAPYGSPEEVLKSAHEKWSLSKGTFPSDLAWLILIEQVYRALSINAGSPYHHE